MEAKNKKQEYRHEQENVKGNTIEHNEEKEDNISLKFSKGNTMDKGKETLVEHFHTLGSFHNALAWGDRKILDLIKKVADLESIA
jgi:hypothetical protein